MSSAHSSRAVARECQDTRGTARPGPGVSCVACADVRDPVPSSGSRAFLAGVGGLPPVARIPAHGRPVIACTRGPTMGGYRPAPRSHGASAHAAMGIGARSHGASGHAATGVGQAASRPALRACTVVCYWERLALRRAARLLTRPRQYGWLFSLPRIPRPNGGPVPWRVVAARRRTTLLQEDVGQ